MSERAEQTRRKVLAVVLAWVLVALVLLLFELPMLAVAFLFGLLVMVLDSWLERRAKRARHLGGPDNREPGRE